MEDDIRILNVLKLTAWERAKGELNALLHTYYGNGYPSHHSDYDTTFDEVRKHIKDFIKYFEDNYT